jgi:hypothetical protein
MMFGPPIGQGVLQAAAGMDLCALTWMQHLNLESYAKISWFLNLLLCRATIPIFPIRREGTWTLS